MNLYLKWMDELFIKFFEKLKSKKIEFDGALKCFRRMRLYHDVGLIVENIRRKGEVVVLND